MEVSNGNLPKPVQKRNDKGRRSWSRREYEVLVAALKEVIAKVWKSKNGFKIGYLQALEHEMKKVLLGTDLKGIPHTNSKIHVWKNDYGSLVMVLSYRVTGEHAEDFIEAFNHVLNGMSLPQEEFPVNLENLSDDFEDEIESIYACQAESTPQTSASGKKSAGRNHMCEIKIFCRNTDARLGEIAKRIGYEYDASLARNEVFGVIGTIQGLSLCDKLLVSNFLSKTVMT
ncbi:hypothetical protein DH2020_014559 [Rehmannia glutinosa]|uniref:Uncharacterized protein n=1 Tax=Rehmannia glutinosa TaxID=99300 RepID=A0ABR0X089_REHGL